MRLGFQNFTWEYIGKKNEIDIFSSYLATNTLTCGVGDVDSSQFQSQFRGQRRPTMGGRISTYAFIEKKFKILFSQIIQPKKLSLAWKHVQAVQIQVSFNHDPQGEGWEWKIKCFPGVYRENFENIFLKKH